MKRNVFSAMENNESITCSFDVHLPGICGMLSIIALDSDVTSVIWTHAYMVGLGFLGQRIRKKVFAGVATLMWSIWKARNLACFQHIWPADPSVVMFRMSHWINEWSFLQVRKDAKVELQWGARCWIESPVIFSSQDEGGRPGCPDLRTAEDEIMEVCNPRM